MLSENTKMALNLYQVSNENKVSILINPISNCAYPGHLDTYKEDHFFDGPPMILFITTECQKECV